MSAEVRGDEKGLAEALFGVEGCATSSYLSHHSLQQSELSMTPVAITSSSFGSDCASLTVDAEALLALNAALESSSESASAVMYACDDIDAG